MAGSAKLPTSGSFWKQAAFLSVVAIVAAYNVKQNIHLRKRSQYRPDELEISQFEKEGDDISRIRPGFPVNAPTTERKSEYEGAPDSYLSKKRGDKLSWSIWR